MTNNLGNGYISKKQFLFAVGCFLQASTLLTAFFIRIALRDSWIMVLFGFAAAVLLVLVYSKLAQYYPDKNLIEINSEIFGTFLGKAVSFAFVLFFFNLAALNVRDVQGFVTDYLMPQTPKIIIIVTFVAVCAYAVRCGLETAVRYGTMFAVLALLMIMTGTVLVASKMHFSNFFPILSISPIKIVQSVNIVSTIPFGETVLFLMITHRVKGERKYFRLFFAGLAIGAATLLIVVIRDIAVLGEGIKLVSLPSFETLRMINIVSGSINRVEAIFAIVLLTLLFFKITFIYYCTCTAIAQIFKMSTYKPLVITVGALISSYAVFIFPSSGENAAFAMNAAPLIWLVFEALIPMILLVTAAIKNAGRNKKEEVKSA